MKTKKQNVNQFINFNFNRMKRIFWGLAALPLLIFLVLSCAREIVESKYDKENQITFSAAVGKQTLTRATEFTYWPNAGTFDVRVHQSSDPSTTPLFSWTLTYDLGTTSWSYNGGTPVDQPGYALSYFAVYPLTNVASFATTGTGGSFQYTVPAVTEDLIAAYTPNESSANVTLTFNHLLSQINFAVQGLTGHKITITNPISLTGVNSVNTYTFGSGWGTPTTPTSYTYVPAAAASVFPTTSAASSDILYLGNTGNIAIGANNANNNALMLMPQSFAPTSGGYFTFGYTITDEFDGAVTNGTGTATAYFGDFTTNTWESGKRYLYLIDFSNLFVGGPITFTVVVNAWTDAANTAQPLYVADASQKAIEQAITAHNDIKSAGLTIFPISLPVDPTDAIELADFDDGNFDVGDKIYIYCPTNTGAAFIDLDAAVTDWSISITDNIVILSKDS